MNSASWAPPCPKTSAEWAAAQSNSWSSPRRWVTHWSSSPTSTPSWWRADCCAVPAGEAATSVLERIVAGTADRRAGRSRTDIRRSLAGRGDHSGTRRRRLGAERVQDRRRRRAPGHASAGHRADLQPGCRRHLALPRRLGQSGSRPRGPRLPQRSTTAARPTWCSTGCGCPPARCSATRDRPGRPLRRRVTRERRRSAQKQSAACEKC